MYTETEIVILSVVLSFIRLVAVSLPIRPAVVYYYAYYYIHIYINIYLEEILVVGGT